MSESRIIVYSISTGKIYELPIPAKPDECVSAWVAGPLTRLPNSNLGFVYECNLDPVGNKETLYMWDREADSLQALVQYPESIAASGYAFAPDMSELIQESAIGAGLNNQLYRVHPDGRLEQLLADYQRVRTPSWSPDGLTIAFMGTMAYPPGEPDTAKEIENLFYYPWDLYLMNVDESNVHMLLSGIVNGSGVQWLPQGKFLSFMGQYRTKEGIWFLNPDTSQVTRLWPYPTAYDWSPDGIQMVIIERDEKTGVAHPAIVNLPSELTEIATPLSR